jgi:hypothetical protein
MAREKELHEEWARECAIRELEKQQAAKLSILAAERERTRIEGASLTPVITIAESLNVRCPFCNRQVSQSAESCPKCGHQFTAPHLWR